MIKLYLYFGMTGILSIIAMLVAVAILLNYCLHAHRTRMFIRAFTIALLAMLLAYINSGNVDRIRIDTSAEERARQEEMAKRRDRELQRIGSRAARIRFAEDSEYDHLDLAGVKDVSQLSKYEAAAQGLTPSAEPELPEYMRGGKQQRITGVGTEEEQETGVMSLEQNDVTDWQDDGYRYLPQADRDRAVKLDRINVKAAKLVLFLAFLGLLLDYFSRFNRTFVSGFPLPAASRTVDTFFPKKHATLVPESHKEVIGQFLRKSVK
ncbi:MAG: hypothetical protein GX811_08805 [Lentisphaerae bacterium]|nr:hypothetical protein [Lentisphaerota bacterium]